ncbi:MAG: cytochrome c [Campylobacteraceae bacterium]|nr:cytochrome c [Campylobacteraceae bacterium]
MKMLIGISVLVILAMGYYFVSGEKNSNGRWYTKEQVVKGKKLFAANCSSCHGLKAEKTIKWRQKLADGSYPPPPLNGSAHAWHHSFAQLMRQINDGGAAYGGKMPGFRGALDENEKKDIISYFQSFWNDKIYKSWYGRSGL